MSERQLLKEKFLAEHNLQHYALEKIPADASYRVYERLRLKDKTYILMDAPPKKEEVKPFIAVAEYLNSHKFSAPQIIARDIKNGFLLLEDFGSETFVKLLANNEDPEVEVRLYKEAVKFLVELQKVPAGDGIFPYYDDEKLLKEVFLFTEWYTPILNGEPISKKLQEEYEIIWRHLLQYVRYIPETTVLRDFHAENLMWLEAREKTARVGVLDFQDAVIGSPIYDMVSLLDDARREVSQDLRDQMISYYLTLRPDITRKEFLASYSILGAQRNLKIIGRFACISVKDRNSNYLKFLPRVWSYIEKDLKHPLLLPLKAWLDKVISPQVRKPGAADLKIGDKISV